MGLVLEEIRACFGRLQPQQAAYLLAWLPADRAVTLLNTQVLPMWMQMICRPS